ncbi:MAG: biotin/lipoyl-binding protein [Pseudomonadales bacterium]|jgi:multidrug efflux pump subunit AcrA (membrane-fusion protein)|nr:biotin/lipoyl-binding protein [Pseudomonadales bacterium]
MIKLSTAHRRAALAAALLLGGGTVAGALVATTPSPEADAPAERAWPVSTIRVAPGPRAPRLSLFGRIEAAATTHLAAPITAPVAEVYVREGDRVTEGQVMVRLDDAEYALALAEREAEEAQAAADLAFAENDLAVAQRVLEDQQSVAAIAEAKLTRHQRLVEQRLIARTLLDEVERDARMARITLEEHRARIAGGPHRIARQRATLDRARVATERARLDLERTLVRAPFAGPVTAVQVARGDQVLAGTALVTLLDSAGIEVRAPLPADRATALREQLARGARVLASTRIDGQTRSLRVVRMAGTQREGRTVVDAFLAFEDADTVEVGRLVELSLALPPLDGLVALPVTALYENTRIYRVRDDRLDALHAEVVGEVDTLADYRLLVRAPGLEAGDRVISTQLPRAMDGLLVTESAQREDLPTDIARSGARAGEG